MGLAEAEAEAGAGAGAEVVAGDVAEAGAGPEAKAEAGAKALNPDHKRVVSPNSNPLGDRPTILCLYKVWAMRMLTGKGR